MRADRKLWRGVTTPTATPAANRYFMYREIPTKAKISSRTLRVYARRSHRQSREETIGIVFSRDFRPYFGPVLDGF